jgi:deoxyribodipyrimidine photo-lyase
MMADAPILLWFRRDLRLTDQPMLAQAAASGRPLLAVFVLDPETEALGAAAKWRLGLGLAAFAAQLARLGLTLVLRRGAALTVLRDLVAETGAGAVWWSRLYDPVLVARDRAVKAALKADGLEARSFNSHLLFEPWTVQSQSGSFYRVFTPFWKAVRGRDPGGLLAAPVALRAHQPLPKGDDLAAWQLGREMRRGAAIVAPWLHVGEAAALQRLGSFLNNRLEAYGEARDFPAQDACSGLSENLTYGEISARQIWHSAWHALHEGRSGAESFLRELVWREFSYHLLHHTPHITERNWKEGWEDFPWRGDNADAESWRRGMTGEPFVDAAMREMYVTGRMHNRARMIVASYLTKHLMVHWTVGLHWFAECLVDWDPAANAMGWQWVAGSGPDAAPFFRIFNPAGQAAKFDARSVYRKRYLAELSAQPPQSALDYFAAVPRSWGLRAQQTYPAPRVDLAEGRARALKFYQERNQTT